MLQIQKYQLVEENLLKQMVIQLQDEHLVEDMSRLNTMSFYVLDSEKKLPLVQHIANQKLNRMIVEQM